jgi:hypothetical protein
MVGVNIVYSAGLASPDPWYLRQHARTAGDPPGTWAYCTQQDVDFMKNQVWQHEGATSGWPPPNHMQYLNTYLQNNDVQVEWERVMAFDANNGALLASQLQLDAIHDQQLQFIDTPLASAQLLNVDPPPWGVGQPFVKPNCTVRP